MVPQTDSFGNYLANIQTGIFTSSFQKLGAEWVYLNLKDDYNRLYYMVSGRCKISVNGLALTPAPGQLLLLPAGSHISATSFNGEPFSKYFCHFTATIGGSRLFDLLQVSSIIQVEDRQSIEFHFQELNKHFSSNGITSVLRAKTVLHQLLCYFIENNPSLAIQDSGHHDMQNISCVLDHINHHLADRLSVQQLAKLAHFHPHYFIHVFKTMMGCSPMQYIAKLRYERACTLLLSTNLSIHEIAVYVGIHPEYFNKFFKNHCGISPTGYRDNRRKLQT